MGDLIPEPSEHFTTKLSDYSVPPQDRTSGPYARNLEVDALIVGAGFGTLQV